MGTFDLRAGILTSGAYHRTAFMDVGAPVLLLGQTLIVLPCGSKQGWEDDQRHRMVLERIEQLGGRTVTVASEVQETTLDAPEEDGSWLLMDFVDDEAQVADSDHEALVRLPVNDFRLWLRLTPDYPESPDGRCVVRLPAGLSLKEAQWTGRFPQNGG